MITLEKLMNITTPRTDNLLVCLESGQEVLKGTTYRVVTSKNYTKYKNVNVESIAIEQAVIKNKTPLLVIYLEGGRRK